MTLRKRPRAPIQPADCQCPKCTGPRAPVAVERSNDLTFIQRLLRDTLPSPRPSPTERTNPMVEPKTYECDCGVTHRSLTGDVPPGWEIQDEKAVCPDCVKLQAAKRCDQQPQSSHTMPLTSIAQTGRPRDAMVSPSPAQRRASTIPLSSGAVLDLSDPNVSELTAQDIAAGQMLPMFCGQPGERYTLAQHSVFLTDLIGRHASALGGRNDRATRWAALMHYAHVPFLTGSIFAKLHIHDDYARIERLLRVRLQLRFGYGVSHGRLQVLKCAERAALYIAQRDLFPSAALTLFDPGDLPETVRNETTGRIWGPEEAQGRFLDAFHDLNPQTPERKAA